MGVYSPSYYKEEFNKSGSKILERYFESESHECYEILRTIKSTFFSSYPVANALDC